MSALGLTAMKLRPVQTNRAVCPIRRLSHPLPSARCEMADCVNAAPTSSMEALGHPRHRSTASTCGVRPTKTYRSQRRERIISSFYVVDPCFYGVASRMRTLVQVTARTKLSVAQCLLPAADTYIFSFEGLDTREAESAQPAHIRQANLMACISSRTAITTASYGLTLAQQLQQEAVAAGKAVLNHRGARAIKAAGVAKHQLHLSQQQANLATAEAAARKAASGLGVCRSTAGAVDDLVSRQQHGFCGDLSVCDVYSLEQEQLGCQHPCSRKRFTVIAVAEAGVDNGLDDVDIGGDQERNFH